ncbi:SMI1/KNR4 family protein [Laceyella tengchongensis]|jgi:cell wall assembly regulator SMI1
MAIWEAVKQPATDEDIQRIEAFVGQRLPRDYVEWAKVYHGSNPGCYIDVDGEPYPFDRWLSISSEAGDDDDFCHVVGAYRQMYLTDDSDPSLPTGFVPFALDGQNKWYCFDYRGSAETPSIVLINWEAHYEDDPDYVVTKIKGSFSELMNSLYYLST